jgi:hypothetical protein
MGEGSQAGQRGRYGLLLLTLIAAYLVSAVTHSRWGGVVHIAFVAAIVLLAVRHSVLSTWQTWLASIVVIGTAIGAGFSITSANKPAEGAANLWSSLMLLITVVIIVNGVLRIDQVTEQSIYGALSAYLLVGLMFAAVYGALVFFVSEPFFANGQPADNQTLQYFSFTTLTTLGYGDFTAAGSLGRAFAVLEALTGQVFLATLVARLVSAYGTSKGKRPPGD